MDGGLGGGAEWEWDAVECAAERLHRRRRWLALAQQAQHAEEVGGAQKEGDAEAIAEWGWACEEREDLLVHAVGFDFFLMKLLRIVALSDLESLDGNRSTGGAVEQQAEGEASSEASGESAWENALALSMLAEIVRTQLTELSTFSHDTPCPGTDADELSHTGAVNESGGGSRSPSASASASAGERLSMARLALRYERCLLLRKLDEIERALEDLSAVCTSRT
jgi:hypothetical protein